MFIGLYRTLIFTAVCRYTISRR